jgi:cystathionine gamma-synthase
MTRYPGLLSHPTHAIARRHLSGYGTIISFDVHGGSSAAEECCRRLHLIRHATSFGAVESVIERRAAVAGQEHIPPSLLRFSVGIDDPDDLWGDLDQALNADSGRSRSGAHSRSVAC